MISTKLIKEIKIYNNDLCNIIKNKIDSNSRNNYLIDYKNDYIKIVEKFKIYRKLDETDIRYKLIVEIYKNRSNDVGDNISVIDCRLYKNSIDKDDMDLEKNFILISNFKNDFIDNEYSSIKFQINKLNKFLKDNLD